MLTEILVLLPSTYRLLQVSWWQLHFSSYFSSNLGVVLDPSLSLIPPIQIVCTSHQLYLQIWNLTLFDHAHCYQSGSSLHDLLPWLLQEALQWSPCAHPRHFSLSQHISQNVQVFLLKLLHNLYPLHNPSDFISCFSFSLTRSTPASLTMPGHSWIPSPLSNLSCNILSMRPILVTLFKIAKTSKS